MVSTEYAPVVMEQEDVMRYFRDRREAGRLLGERLLGLGIERPVVLGIPRGGVPVAAAVAEALGCPFDVIVVRKLGAPTAPEVAMGAVGERGAVVWNEDVIAAADASGTLLDAVRRREEAEVASRVRRFRGGADPVPLEGATAVVVDDGVATGATARVACRIARELGAARVVLGVPVAAPDAIARFAEADEVVCLHSPAGFMSVGMHYVDFGQTPDEEVALILASR